MPALATSIENPTVRGYIYRQTHEATVQSVLLERAPKVSSRGTAFFNVDRWTTRIFTFHMCKWGQDNPACVPTEDDVRAWVDEANNEVVKLREIVIANTPDQLPIRTAMALTGGGYHEAWHSLYSCRRTLTVREMCKLVLPRWAKIPNWAAVHGILQDWSNIIEDIRIERLGCVEFPGAPSKMADLQDFILDQEKDGLMDARRHAVKAGAPPEAVKRGALSIVSGAFRDKGLGYKTRTQQIAWQGYVKANPDAVQMVTAGPLTPMLEESISLSRTDDLGCLRVAMDALVVLVQQSCKQDQDQQDRDEAKDGEQGDGEQKCKSCGAPAHKLVVRPKSDGHGGKVKGIGVVTCTVCGHQEEVQVKTSNQPKNRDQQLKDAKKGPGPKWEGWDPEDLDSPGGGGEGDESEDGDESGKGGKGKSKDGDDKDGDDKDGKGSGGKGDESDEDGESAGGEGDGEGDEDGDDAEPTPGEGDEDGDEATPGEGQWSDDFTDNPNDTSPESGKPSGKDSGQKGASMAQGDAADKPVEGNDFSDVANDAVSDAEQGKGTGLKDNNSALGDSVEEAVEKETGTVLEGEKAYRPYDPSKDQVIIVPPSSRGRSWDAQQARNMLDSVREQTSYLRARLANIFRALEQVDIVHGTRTGLDLSDPFLVDTALDIMAGARPDRAYYQQDEVLDTSMSAVIVLDESSSMQDTVNINGRRTTLTEVATRIMIAITEPLDRLGIPVMATGFRNAPYNRNSYRNHYGPSDEGTLTPEEKGDFTRYHGHVTDVFKTFDERFADVMWRFANTRGTGGTPMADGMQFGLDSLNYRNEGHRVMFVVTDGCPSGNIDVINWQLRIAKEAGVHIIGVGLGEPAKYVRDLFPDHVWSVDFNEFPTLLLNKLNALIDSTASKRGQRMAL